ncbi:MAG: class B sortase [Eubacteriaceae bacterium]|jgi:sortase B
MTKTKKKKRSFLSNLIIYICIIVIIGCIIALLNTYWPDIQSYQTYRGIRADVINDDNGDHTINWDSLLAQNPETVGWVWIPDTIVDYPVVQTDNNDYYLDHDFTRSYNKFGNVFLDCDFSLTADPAMQNSVLYGHSSTYGNQIGFNGLNKYEDSSYWQSHPTVYYTRVNEGDQPIPYQIFAVIKVAADYDYRQPQFADQEAFLAYYDRIIQASLYNTGITVSPNDQIVTLSTCVFDIDDGRIAVIARRAQ